MSLTLQQFKSRYGSEEECLAILAGSLSCCGALRPLRGYSRYQCQCGKQFSPRVGTIFEHSSTPLTTWFLVLYLVSITKSGVSAKQIQRLTGLTYKSAWRCLTRIRSVMTDEGLFTGAVEIDETFFKAKPWRNSRIPMGHKAFFAAPTVFGAVERSTGRAKVKVMPNLRAWTVRDTLQEMVEGGSAVYSDGSRSYDLVRRHYAHYPRTHWGTYIPGQSGFKPAKGDSTQNIENLWGNMKRGIYGVYRHASPQHLQGYANEYAWRYSHRKDANPFEALLERAIGRSTPTHQI